MDFGELRTRLSALEETRKTAERELRTLQHRTKRLEQLERDKDSLLESYSSLSCPKIQTPSGRKNAIGCIEWFV